MAEEEASPAAASAAERGPHLLVVMGVSGSGKSTVGSHLADKLGWKFYEGDDYHPDENKKKMAEGIPLNDQLIQRSAGPFMLDRFEPSELAGRHYFLSGKTKANEAMIKMICDSKASYDVVVAANDRIPWLCCLHDILKREHTSGQNAILACSALKKMYRQILENGKSGCESGQQENQGGPESLNILFVHLHGSIDLIAGRLRKRKGHFMPLSLLQSQFDTLEPPSPPERFITINLEKSISEIVSEIEDYIRKM